MTCSVIESYLGIGVAELFADSDLGLMLAQELSPNDVAIFGHDAYQSIDILCMFPNQFGQFGHLALKMFDPPQRIGTAVLDRLLSRLLSRFLFHQRRDQYIPLHADSFAR